MGEKIRKDICKICCDKYLGNKKLKDLGVCAGCLKDAPERVEVTFGNMIIHDVGFEPNVRDKTFVTTRECRGLDKRRPDLCWVIPHKVAVVVEIDEHSHESYDESCEVRKISEQNLAIQQSPDCLNVPVYTIRVNPDKYELDVPIEERARVVAELVKRILENEHEPNAYAKIYFCYYNANAEHLIEAQKKH